MRISQKLIVSYTAIFLCTAATAFAGWFGMKQLEAELGNLSGEVIPHVQQSLAMKAAVIDYRNRETQLLVTRSEEEITETLGRMNKNLAELTSEQQALTALMIDAEETALLRQYQDKLAAYLHTHQQFERMIRDGDKEAALSYFRGDARTAFRQLLPAIDDLVKLASTKASEGKRDAEKTSYEVMLAIVGISLFAVLIGVLMGGWLFNSIVPRLRSINAASVAMANRLDFTTQLEVGADDEVGETVTAINSMTAATREALSQLLNGIGQNAMTSSQLERAAIEASASACRQSEAAASMAATVEELTVSIGQVSNNANRAFELSRNSGDAARNGSSVIAESVRQMRNIATRIEQTAEFVDQLGKASNEINGIVQVIRDVAEQTNLLALNAAIEAARAGEQGRGFAVVADEVRNLAARTALATSDISGKIAGIQSGVQSATNSMSEAVTLVENGVVIADSAGESVKLITVRATEVEGEVNQISLALSEQSQASNQIANHIEQIAQMSDHNSQNAESTAQGARDLVALAGKMRGIAERFKV